MRFGKPNARVQIKGYMDCRKARRYPSISPNKAGRTSVSSGRPVKAVGRLHSALAQKVGGGTSGAASLVSERSAVLLGFTPCVHAGNQGQPCDLGAIEMVVVWRSP